MDKKSFINSVNFEDKNMLSNLYDKIILAEKISRPVFTNEFFPPNVWKTISGICKGLSISTYANGIFQDSERRMMCFSIEEPDDYPIQLVRIENKSKFEELGHRDYLGAIMALGIKREKYGDLVLDGDGCYAAVSEEISDYIIYNLDSIGRCPCRVELIKDFDARGLSAKFENLIIHSTSMRMDCLIGSLCNLSRAKVVEIIQGGKVLIDYVEINEKDKLVQTGSVITIRGYGKFKLVEQLGSTQRGRLKLSIKKYI